MKQISSIFYVAVQFSDNRDVHKGMLRASHVKSKSSLQGPFKKNSPVYSWWFHYGKSIYCPIYKKRT